MRATVILAALLAASAIHAGEVPLGHKYPEPEAPTSAKADKSAGKLVGKPEPRPAP